MIIKEWIYRDIHISFSFLSYLSLEFCRKILLTYKSNQILIKLVRSKEVKMLNDFKTFLKVEKNAKCDETHLLIYTNEVVTHMRIAICVTSMYF